MRKIGAQGGQPLAGAIADNGENGRFWGKTELLREEGEKRGGSSPECGEAAGEAAPWPSVNGGHPKCGGMEIILRRGSRQKSASGCPAPHGYASGSTQRAGRFLGVLFRQLLDGEGGTLKLWPCARSCECGSRIRWVPELCRRNPCLKSITRGLLKQQPPEIKR